MASPVEALLASIATATTTAKSCAALSSALHDPSSLPQSLTSPLTAEQGVASPSDLSVNWLVDVLETKTGLMSCYVGEFANYLSATSCGTDAAAIKNYDATNLATMSSALLRMRGIDKKLDYAIRKTAERGTEYIATLDAGGKVDVSGMKSWSGAGSLMSSTNSSSKSNKNQNNDDDSDSEDEELDNIRKKVSGFDGVKATQEGSDEDSDIDESEDDQNDDDDDRKAAPFMSDSKAYQAPKNRAVDFEPASSQRSDKINKKNLERMRKSEIMDNLRAEFTDKPEETGVDGVSGVGGGGLMVDRAAAAKIAQAEKERTEFEEERMVRLVTGRKEKKEKARLERKQVSVNALADFSSFADGINSFQQEDSFGKGERRAGKVNAETGSKRHVNGKRVREDIDVDGSRAKRGGKGKAMSGLQMAVMGGGGGGGAGGSKKSSSRKR
jgi:hypothetical protein